MLNAVFSHFDELAARYGMEKIKTIGDAYMVVAGVPESDPRHAHQAARLALDMRAAVASRRFAGHRIDLRVGINSGPVVAGVIGRRKFIYDVWGRAVNMASRMESQGEPGCIQLTRETWEMIRDEFDCRAMGERQLKGYGPVEVWTLLGELPRTEPSGA
jgi:guanylate cyclase